MFESEKMKQICTDLHDIGMRLESKTICKIVEEAKRKLNYPSKLRVAFITDQFRGASMALKESFGLAALPEEIKPIQIVSSAKIVYTKQDVESNEPAYVLKKESEQPYSFMLGRKEDSLEYTDAQILYSRNNYEDFDWKIELAQVDYAFLVVSAIQMLNISERKLIEEALLKYFGLSRFSIILADTEMIQSVDAYNEVKARLERYLKSIGTDGTYYELGTEGLDLFVSHSLEKEKEELRALSTYMTVRLCYEDVKCELLKIKEQSLISIEELEKCLDVLKMREKTMREKGTMAACRMRDELKGRIYYNISCAHQKLYTQMCQEIYKTIDASENIKKHKKKFQGL